MELPEERVKNTISSLIEKYEDVLKRGEESIFLEEDVKIKFINPLLMGLGWNVE